MDIKLFAAVFGTVFLAEIADKTQVVTLLYASNVSSSKLAVFLGSAAALILASAINVWAGSMLSQWMNPKYMAWLAGAAFIAVGVFTVAATR
jgi:putative Ca2+/H+ antiporter (TMEM165/GDT1 family)